MTKKATTPTPKFKISEFTLENELKLMREIYAAYLQNPWQIPGCEIETPNGIFKNIGGFNGTPGDLWMVKKGTMGKTQKTFWRFSIGSKRRGFEVFLYDFKSEKIGYKDRQKIADRLGLKLTSPESATATD